MNSIWVDADMIWTPNLYFSNRVQDFGPNEEVQLRCNIAFDGLVTCYRSLREGLQNKVDSKASKPRAPQPIRFANYLKALLRLRAQYTSDSTNYPYDTQITELQIQSRDYSKVFIEITTKTMNKAYGLRESAKELEPTENLDVLKNELFASRRVSKLCQDNHSGRLVRCLNAIKY